MNATEQRSHKTALTALDDKFETALSAFATAAGERCDGIEARIAAVQYNVVDGDEGLNARIDGVQIDFAAGDEAVLVEVTRRLNRERELWQAALQTATEPLRRNFWGRLLWALGVQ